MFFELDLHPDYPRHANDDDDAVLALAESIGVHGLLHPLIVRQNLENPDRFWIVSGGRRLIAARLAKLEFVTVLCGVRDSEVSFIIENVHREDLHPITRALEVARLSRLLRLSQTELGRRLCLSRAEIVTDISLARLPAEIRAEALQFGNKISRNHLVEIAQCIAQEEQVLLWEQTKAGATRDELRAAKRTARCGTPPQTAKRLASSIKATATIAKALADIEAAGVTEADIGSLAYLKASVTAIAARIAEIEQRFAKLHVDQAAGAV